MLTSAIAIARIVVVHFTSPRKLLQNRLKKYKDITNFDELIELEYGKIGTESRNEYEEGAQMFIVNEMLKSARKEAKMTQQQLAEKAGTKKDLT